MTPGGRYAAAIEILDQHLAGDAAEKALTNWARSHRFAGSGDRAAIRDLVFDALRNKLSFAAAGGEMTGRGLMIGQLRQGGVDPSTIFTGEGYNPSLLSEAELRFSSGIVSEATELDCPEWLIPELRNSLGENFAQVMRCLKQRAPLYLRVNLRRADRNDAAEALHGVGIKTAPSELSPAALKVRSNERKVSNTTLYRDGLIEIQDAASQWVSDHVPIKPGMRVLDYCAGGGGKSLAMAARCDAEFVAHDRFARRMSDLPARAKRSGVTIQLCETSKLPSFGKFDVILCDVPCSGSGAWRRSPEGKWSLDRDMLSRIIAEQSEILDQASALVMPGGVLAYATCSLLKCENQNQVEGFLLRTTGWICEFQKSLTPLDGADGFFLSVLRRS